MLSRLIFALIIFALLLIIPSASLSFFEHNINVDPDIMAVSWKLPSNNRNNKNNISIIEDSIPYTDISTPKTIKVFNSKTKKVMVLPFEEYVLGVVASEMPSSFNEEALKAQAVTARTYLLYRLNKYPNGHPDHPDASICTDVHCQAWHSFDELIALNGEEWYNTSFTRVQNAVKDTNGQILTYEGQLIEPLFHSTSGGKTENSEDVFMSEVPYLRSVESLYEQDAPKLKSSVKLSVSEFIEKIKSIYGNLDITPSNLSEKVQLGELSEGGKIKTIYIDGIEITGKEMRSIFNLNSTDFSFIQSEDYIEIVTTGYGHGVGMSQYGANGMAEQGYNYKDILKHYYTGVKIVSMK